MEGPAQQAGVRVAVRIRGWMDQAWWTPRERLVDTNPPRCHSSTHGDAVSRAETPSRDLNLYAPGAASW